MGVGAAIVSFLTSGTRPWAGVVAARARVGVRSGVVVLARRRRDGFAVSVTSTISASRMPLLSEALKVIGLGTRAHAGREQALAGLDGGDVWGRVSSMVTREPKS